MPMGERVRIVTEGRTGVVLLAGKTHVIVELDDGSGLYNVPRWDLEACEAAG